MKTIVKTGTRIAVVAAVALFLSLIYPSQTAAQGSAGSPPGLAGLEGVPYMASCNFTMPGADIISSGFGQCPWGSFSSVAEGKLLVIEYVSVRCMLSPNVEPQSIWAELSTIMLGPVVDPPVSHVIPLSAPSVGGPSPFLNQYATLGQQLTYYVKAGQSLFVRVVRSTASSGVEMSCSVSVAGRIVNAP